MNLLKWTLALCGCTLATGLGAFQAVHLVASGAQPASLSAQGSDTPPQHWLEGQPRHWRNVMLKR